MSIDTNNMPVFLKSTVDNFKINIEKIKSKYAKDIEDVSGEKIDPNTFEAMINIDFEVTWERTEIKFDIPKFRKKRVEIKFDVPTVKMELEHISFDVPAIRMVKKCVAKVPEFRHWKWYSKCIYAHVPEPYKKRVDIKLDIPKISKKRVDLSFDVPEVYMERVEISFHLPQFTAKNVKAEFEKTSVKIQVIAGKMNSELKELEVNFKNEVDKKISEQYGIAFEGSESNVSNKREQITLSYDSAIKELKKAINALKNSQAIEKVQQLESELASLITEYQNVLQEFDSKNKQQGEEQAEHLMSTGYSFA